MCRRNIVLSVSKYIFFLIRIVLEAELALLMISALIFFFLVSFN